MTHYARARRSARLPLATAVAGSVVWAASAAAQVPLERLPELFARTERPWFAPGLVVNAAGARQLGGARSPGRAVWLPVGERHWVMRAPEAELSSLVRERGLHWSPPRHLSMDRARGVLRLDVARAAGAGSGQGVVIGIVDSGVDASHPDLRHTDGSTRLAWWLDFAADPAGLHPELEAALGCQAEAGLRCRVLDAADLDERLDNDVIGDEPRDTLGHGTIVAAIAAGNGAARGGAEFAGVAPEATLIAARVTGAVGTIADSDVVLATRFVFERAAELGLPAVVNLSLGSDFGAHDGSSELAAALAELVGPAFPGRAIVVAAGNSGELHTGVATGWPEPFGIHSEVVATRGAPAQLALATPFPSSGRDTTDASLFVWLDLYPAESLSVGIQLPDGTRIQPVAREDSQVVDTGELVVGVLNGLGSDADRESALGELPDLALDDVWPKRGSAVVLVDGRWPAGRGFTLEIEGEGRAELWVQSEGDLSPEAGSIGALFSGATARSTVAIPAAHPGLIAVGASVDRLEWTDYSGTVSSVAALPVQPAPELGAAAFFSSAGPSSSGDFKPELLGPGAFVISAMSNAADPRRGAFGIFSGGLCTGAACQVIADGYALTAGTSMAAPMVTGAVALLLERQPNLTQGELRGLLITGSSALAVAADAPSREGAGVLDVARSLAAQRVPPAALERPASEQSRLRAAAESVVPDATRSLSVLLWLRDAAGEVFDASLERVGVAVAGGELREPAQRIAPGLYQLAVSAPSDAPTTLSIDVALDSEPFLSLALPIEGGGRTSDRSDDGGCSVASTLAPAPSGGLWGLACALSLWLVRRRPLRAR